MSEEFLEPEDLLTDESFLSWYFGPGREADGFLNGWAAGNPARKELLDRAVRLLEMTKIVEKPLPEEKTERATKTLLERIDRLGAVGTNGGTIGMGSGIETAERGPGDDLAERTARGPGDEVAKVKRMFRRRLRMAAACALVIATAGITLLRTRANTREQFTTTYGQVILHRLPDGSEVTMNANSRLRVATGWQDGADREVWIDGEAFFHVSKTPKKSRFIVHTEKFDIIVTGTQFNVVNRGGTDNVMLREGSVIVHPAEGADVAMVPGDFLKWNGTGLEKEGVKTDSLLAWKQHQLIFDRTPLKDVVGIIKDQYGVQIELEGPSIGDSTITGIMRNDNLDVLLQALETTSDYEVIRKDGKIAIKASAQ